MFEKLTNGDKIVIRRIQEMLFRSQNQRNALMKDSEFDIEGIDVYSVDRMEDGITTCISFYDKNGEDNYAELCTPIERHNDYVNRFRVKLCLTSDKEERKINTSSESSTEEEIKTID